MPNNQARLSKNQDFRLSVWRFRSRQVVDSGCRHLSIAEPPAILSMNPGNSIVCGGLSARDGETSSGMAA